MKIISYRNSIVKGNEQKISLKTLNGKTGYRITKFQILPGNMEVGSNEATVKIYKDGGLGTMDRPTQLTIDAYRDLKWYNK